jgi:hypothetical protein
VNIKNKLLKIKKILSNNNYHNTRYYQELEMNKKTKKPRKLEKKITEKIEP